MEMLNEALSRIEAELERLERLIANRRRAVEDSDNQLAHADQHQGDLGTDMFERTKELEIEAAELHAAKERIHQGTYGIDEITGEPIDPQRLEAVPTARTNASTVPAAMSSARS